MEKVQTFCSSFTFLRGFMFTCICIQMILGKDVLTKFLWLILAGMILTNVDMFTTVLSKAGTAKQTEPAAVRPNSQNITSSKNGNRNIWIDGSAGAMF